MASPLLDRLISIFINSAVKRHSNTSTPCFMSCSHWGINVGTVWKLVKIQLLAWLLQEYTNTNLLRVHCAFLVT